VLGTYNEQEQRNFILAEIVLIRGLPGSGKTTLAKQMTSHMHVEADMFFEKDGGYQYDPKQVLDAHAWCLEQVKAALKESKNVVVANTFMKKWEMKPYYQLNHPVRVVIANGNYPNVHGVPAEKLELMRNRWEN
jgi:uridine kinase